MYLDDEPDDPDFLSEESLKLRTRFEACEEEFRRIGLYDPIVDVIPTQTGLGLLVRMTVGDVCFTPRVQSPEQHDIDKELVQLEAELTTDEFLDARSQIKKNIAEGRHPFAVDEDG